MNTKEQVDIIINRIEGKEKKPLSKRVIRGFTLVCSIILAIIGFVLINDWINNLPIISGILVLIIGLVLIARYIR